MWAGSNNSRISQAKLKNAFNLGDSLECIMLTIIVVKIMHLYNHTCVYCLQLPCLNKTKTTSVNSISKVASEH